MSQVTFFIGKFSQAEGTNFKANKNGDRPFIGTVLAGTAHSTIIDGTMFRRTGLDINKMILCSNEQEPYEGVERWRCTAIAEADLASLILMQKEGRYDYSKKATEVVIQPVVESVLPD